MMHRMAGLGLALILAGCAAPSTSSLDTPSTASNADAAPLTLRFYMLQDRSQADDARILKVEDHPCGHVAIVGVPPVPMESSAFEIARFIELDERGTSVRTWRGPTDVFVSAISGDRLGIGHSSGPTFWIDTTGDVDAREGTGTHAFDWITCPVPTQFEASDFRVCVTLPDEVTGAPRLISYERPCS